MRPARHQTTLAVGMCVVLNRDYRKSDLTGTIIYLGKQTGPRQTVVIDTHTQFKNMHQIDASAEEVTPVIHCIPCYCCGNLCQPEDTLNTCLGADKRICPACATEASAGSTPYRHKRCGGVYPNGRWKYRTDTIRSYQKNGFKGVRF